MSDPICQTRGHHGRPATHRTADHMRDLGVVYKCAECARPMRLAGWDMEPIRRAASTQQQDPEGRLGHG